MAAPSAVCAANCMFNKRKQLLETVIKKYKQKHPQRFLIMVIMKEKRKYLGKRTGHYFDKLNQHVQMSFSSFK
jgi:hypothetical protein